MSVYSNKSGEDIDSCLHHWSKTHPQKLAIADSQQRLTWQALDRKLNQVANALIQSRFRTQSTPAILGRNSVDYALLFLGGLRAGLCIVPLSPLASSESLAGMINDSEAKLLFVSKDFWSLIDSVTDKLTSLLPDGLKSSMARVWVLMILIDKALPPLLRVLPPTWWIFLSHSTGVLILFTAPVLPVYPKVSCKADDIALLKLKPWRV